MINDAGAFQYAGKAVEVHGLVSAVPISPLGISFINFGREYSNQTFAGFIASAQESLTPVVRKTVPLLMVALSLILTASHSHAGLGWTLAQLKQQYGKPVLNQEQIAGRVGYVFAGEDYVITVYFLNRQVSRIMYICRSGSAFSWEWARALLGANAPEAIWSDASRNGADNTYRVSGTKDGVETYYASLTDDGKRLVIWTKDDDEAGRTGPNLDTPPFSSFMDPNEKRTGDIIAEPAPSIDSRLAPETHPDVEAIATSWSTSHSPDSAHTAHKKIHHKRLRSSMHPRYVDVKKRLIALWHQSLRHEKSRRRTLISNSKKETRKKVSYTAETRH